jgi:hypothetical protein
MPTKHLGQDFSANSNQHHHHVYDNHDPEKRSIPQHNYNHNQNYNQSYNPNAYPYAHSNSNTYSSPPSGSSSRRSSAGNVLTDYTSGTSAGGLGFSSLGPNASNHFGGIEAGNGHAYAYEKERDGDKNRDRERGVTGRGRSRWKSKVFVLLGMRFGWIVLVIWYEVGVVSAPSPQHLS